MIYFDKFINEMTNEVFGPIEAVAHERLPKCIIVTPSTFYYELLEDTAVRHRGRLIYEEEGVWDTEDGDLLELEIRVDYNKNEMMLKAKHYNSISGANTIKDGVPVIHRYTAPYYMTEEDHFQQSCTQELLPFEFHQYLYEYFQKLQEEYQNVQHEIEN